MSIQDDLHEAKVRLNNIEGAANRHLEAAISAAHRGDRHTVANEAKAAHRLAGDADYCRNEIEHLARRAADMQRDIAYKFREVLGAEFTYLKAADEQQAA